MIPCARRRRGGRVRTAAPPSPYQSRLDGGESSLRQNLDPDCRYRGSTCRCPCESSPHASFHQRTPGMQLTSDPPHQIVRADEAHPLVAARSQALPRSRNRQRGATAGSWALASSLTLRGKFVPHTAESRTASFIHALLGSPAIQTKVSAGRSKPQRRRWQSGGATPILLQRP